MSYFTFKDKSSAEFGSLKQLPYAIKAERTMNITEMLNGMPVISYSGMKPGKLAFRIGLKNRDKIDDLYAWLNGSGKLIKSDDLTKYYKAYCSGPLTPEYVSKRLGEVSVNFVTEPYRYAVTNTPVTPTLTVKSDNATLKDCTLAYAGTVAGEPIIKITGSGEIHMWINHNEIKIENVTDNVTVNIETLRVKDKDGNIILNKTIGRPDLFVLNPGDNYIEVSSNVTAIEVTKNERWY